jgi:hypothetical protein
MKGVDELVLSSRGLIASKEDFDKALVEALLLLGILTDNLLVVPTLFIQNSSQRHCIIPPIYRMNPEIAPAAPDLLVLAI